MFRLVSFLIGYVLGCLLTAYFVVKKVCGKSPFEIGSGNPGMANVMAQCGFEAGICVLVGDLLKTVLACVLTRFVIYSGETGTLACLYAGLGVVCGHNFPIWHRFKGGKGVSATCAAMFCMHPLLGIAAMLVGMVVTFITKYLSVGALFIPIAFIPVAYMMCQKEGAAVYVLMSLIMLFCHRHDYVRITKGTEQKIDVPALIKKKFFSGKKVTDKNWG